MSGVDLKTSDDNMNYKAIFCEQIPELFLDKMVAKNHFSKFGKIKRFILRPKRLCCTIEYENMEDAKNALLNAGSFNGVDFIVKYAENEVAHVQNTEEWVDPEVQAELEAMSPGHSLDAVLSYKSNLTNRISKYSNNLLFPPKSSKAITKIKQNSPQPDTEKIDSIMRQEIESILKIAAFTDEEKYRVLDARDKLIRMTTVRQTDIKKAMATKGTCPDMCPEKERLMREFQRQVSIFEMSEEEGSESKISHKKAIKEYSRSSADQEVPLSHELRSERVLQMTMLYLVHRIMGLCDDPKTSLCDWFHFVWDRTRSIRKDITQQELCSVGSVQLVEQCARFHIHCAARLVAEDPSVFDKKINAENLTKCLQTLKYMYHDLRIKGVECLCEAEFRSYIILLNLGDSNFLWEVKQLPEVIQKSNEIKRAIAFYNALQNNNFVKFFSMIKMPETSYLSACILLGYFTKLRVRAMDAIIKSHNWRKNDVYLPLSYLTSILGFDDESSAISFFNHYGLQCDVLDKRILIERLLKPNIEYTMDRALKLVESKRQVSVGECIFGQTLPPASLFEHHEPHSSFDNNGMLKIQSFTAADDHLIKMDVKPKIQSIFLEEQPETTIFKMPKIVSPKQQKNQYLQQEQKTIKDIKDDVLNSSPNKREERDNSLGGFKFSDNIFKGTTTTPKSTDESIFKKPTSNVKFNKISNSSFDTIFKTSKETALTTLSNTFSVSATKTESKNNIFNTPSIFQHKDIPKTNFVFKIQEFSNISSETTLPAAKQKIERENIPRNETNNRDFVVENELKDKIKQKKELHNVESKILSKIEDREDADKQINKPKSILEDKSEKKYEPLINHLIEEEVYRIAQTELLISQTILEASDKQLDILITDVVNGVVNDLANEEYALVCYDQLLLSRYFGRWLMHLRKKKQQRKLIENTPLWITTDTRAQYVQAIKHPCQQENMQMIKRYRFGQPCDLNLNFKMTSSKHENPLNLFALVGQHLLSKRNFTSCGLLQQRKYFKIVMTLPGNEEELVGFESFLSNWLTSCIQKCQTDSGPFINGIERNVALCVRKFTGITAKNEQGNEMTVEGDHNDGMICFISGIEINTQSRKRLYNLLKLTKNLKRIPLAVIAYNCNYDEKEISELLDLDVLQEEGLIHSYVILGCQINRRDFCFRNFFIKSVDFIARESYLLNASDIEALAMQNILPFLETSLGDEMWQRWHSSTKNNPVFNKLFFSPVHVLGIYHKALDHLLHITQEDFDEMPEFPYELREIVPENLSSNIPLGLEFFPGNWKNKTEKKLIGSFLKHLCLPDIESEVPTDIEDLKLWLLQYISKCIKDDDFVVARTAHEAITNLVSQVNHQYFQNFELSSINYLTVFKPIIFAHINRMLKLFKKQLINLRVIYLKDDLKNYQTQPWWLNYEPLNRVTVDYNESISSIPQTTQTNSELNSISDDGIDNIISKAEETARKVDESISELKQRKRVIYRNSFLNFGVTSQLKRTLDDSLYQFEIAKKVGQYNTSFATDLTHDIDKSISKVLSQQSLSTRKRKLSSLNSSDQHLDIDNVIARATKLIQDVECMKDKKFMKKY